MEILYFKDDVRRFIASLDVRTRAKISEVLFLLADYGFRLRMPYAKKIKQGLFELRISTTVEVRIFYTFFHHAIILLHIIVKKTQKIPLYELVVAQERLSILLKT